MDDLIQILFIAFFILITVIGKRKKKSDIPDFIPEIKGEDQGEGSFADRAEFVEDKPIASALEEKEKEPLVKKSAYRPVVSASNAKKQGTKGKHSAPSAPKISLRTRAEARKAFLYSEIFSRKYEN